MRKQTKKARGNGKDQQHPSQHQTLLGKMMEISLTASGRSQKNRRIKKGKTSGRKRGRKTRPRPRRKKYKTEKKDQVAVHKRGSYGPRPKSPRAANQVKTSHVAHKMPGVERGMETARQTHHPKMNRSSLTRTSWIRTRCRVGQGAGSTREQAKRPSAKKNARIGG